MTAVAGLNRSEAGELQLTRRGLRFAHPATERAYRDWHAVKALPFARDGMVGSMVAWGLVLAATVVMQPEDQARFRVLILAVMVPAQIISVATTRVPALHKHVLLGTAMANAIAGLLGVYLSFGFSPPRTDLSMAAAALVTYFGFVVFRLHPVPASIAVGSYVCLHLGLMTNEYLAGRATLETMVLYSLTPVIAYSTGLLACLSISRASRETYQHERIIEAQRRMIDGERARADQLLDNILPNQIADRLKRSHSVIADRFNDVTVLFADLVGITPLAARLSPEELVAILNDVFTRFDEVAARFGVEKIKTIGDAYMAVAGAPSPRADHAVAAAGFALAMRASLDEYNVRNGQALKLRIGLSSGPVVAGVIGATRFAYDLWGDTVNTAARMESHSLEGEIQVSELTHRLLVDQFELEDRGVIEVKGKGPMRTWILISRQSAAKQ